MKKVLILLIISVFAVSCLKEVPEPDLHSNPYDSAGVRYPTLVKYDSSRFFYVSPQYYLKVYIHFRYSEVPFFMGKPQRLDIFREGVEIALGSIYLTPTDTNFVFKDFGASPSFGPKYYYQLYCKSGYVTEKFKADM